MPNVRHKTLHYRRASYPQEAPQGHALEQSLAAALKKCATRESRRVALADGHVVDCLRYLKRNDGHFLQLAVYTPGERASVIPTRSTVRDSDVPVIPPPSEHDFMDGDLMLLVAANHVLISASGFHDAKVSAYLFRLFSDAELNDFELRFTLGRVADSNKVSMIEKEGVKEIALNATLYEASLERVKRQTHREKLPGAVVDELLSLFRQEPSLREVAERENITAEVILKFDRRRKGGETGK